MNQNLKNLKRVALHSATVKHLNLGHFWVTEDSFTKRFPTNEKFLIGYDSVTKKDVGLFINDPEHKNVKARFFSKDLNIDFESEIKNRIHLSIKKRLELKLKDERDNVLLINGEADQLPGLLVLILNEQVLIQYYAFYWKHFEDLLLKNISEAMNEFFSNLNVQDYWIQERTFDQKKSIKSLNNSSLPEFNLSEFGVHYKLKINAYYDYGIYTDMSAIRKNILPFIKNKKNGLNLYCYTGAYSLFALHHQIEKMTSVDLSEKYLNWLEENLELNKTIKKENHRSINLSVEKAIEKFHYDQEKFDFIFCDPPSSSSDGDKRENSFNAYEKLLPSLLEILTRDGALIVFLNTHQISWNKFEEKLKSIISSTRFKDQIIIGKRFKLSEDYLPPKGFHEGDYLKGLLIEFKNKKEIS